MKDEVRAQKNGHNGKEQTHLRKHKRQCLGSTQIDDHVFEWVNSSGNKSQYTNANYYVFTLDNLKTQ